MNGDDKGRVAMAQMVRKMREQMPAEIELAQLMARITRAKYLSLVDQGFTEAQALMLCK